MRRLTGLALAMGPLVACSDGAVGAERALREAFPGQAARVLERGEGFSAGARGFTRAGHPGGGPGALDVADLDAVGHVIRGNHVKVVINLAALLSGASEAHRSLANKINLEVPLSMMDKAEEWGLRKLMIPSSIAAVEIPDNAPEEVRKLKNNVP